MCFFRSANFVGLPRENRNRGFTLLLAALVSSIVLALGASIFTLARKEVMLSSLGRDSQYAFYSADQAAECALYWDSRWLFFGTSTPSNVTAPNPMCDGQTLTDQNGADINLQRPSPASYPYTMTFKYSPRSAAVSYCAIGYVQKTQDVSGIVRTTIHTDGYSSSCTTLASNPRTLQRSVELHY